MKSGLSPLEGIKMNIFSHYDIGGNEISRGDFVAFIYKRFGYSKKVRMNIGRVLWATPTGYRVNYLRCNDDDYIGLSSAFVSCNKVYKITPSEQWVTAFNRLRESREMELNPEIATQLRKFIR